MQTTVRRVAEASTGPKPDTNPSERHKFQAAMVQSVPWGVHREACIWRVVSSTVMAVARVLGRHDTGAVEPVARWWPKPPTEPKDWQ
jgi:hypothetical protein